MWQTGFASGLNQFWTAWMVTGGTGISLGRCLGKLQDLVLELCEVLCESLLCSGHGLWQSGSGLHRACNVLLGYTLPLDLVSGGADLLLCAKLQPNWRLILGDDHCLVEIGFEALWFGHHVWQRLWVPLAMVQLARLAQVNSASGLSKARSGRTTS